MSPQCAFSAVVIVASLGLTSSLSAQSPADAAADQAPHPGTTATMPTKSLTNADLPEVAPSLTPAELEDLTRVKFDKVYTAGRAVASAQYPDGRGSVTSEIPKAQSEVLQGVVDRGGCRDDEERESIVPTVPDSIHQVRARNRSTRRQRIIGLEGQGVDAGGGGSPRCGQQNLSREGLSIRSRRNCARFCSTSSEAETARRWLSPDEKASRSSLHQRGSAARRRSHRPESGAQVVGGERGVDRNGDRYGKRALTGDSPAALIPERTASLRAAVRAAEALLLKAPHP